MIETHAGEKYAAEFDADRDIPSFDLGAQVAQAKQAPNMEIAMRRLSKVTDALAQATGLVEARTAPVRHVIPRPDRDNGKGQDVVGSDLTRMVHEQAGQLEETLARLTRVAQEIDL